MDTLITTSLVIFCVVLGLFVFIKGIKSLVNRLFFYFSISLALWILSSLIARFCVYDTVTPWVNIGFAASASAGYYFLVFCIKFPTDIFKNKKWLDILTTLVPIFFIISSIMGLVATPITEDGTSFVVGQSLLYVPFSIFLFSYIIGGLVVLGYKYKKLIGTPKYQVLYVLIGLSLTSAFALLTSLVLPWIFDNSNIYKWGIYATIFFVGSTAYSIVAHHLFDIRVIVKKSIVYSVLLIFVLATYAAVIFIFAAIFNGNGQAITVKTMLPNLVAAIFIAAGFEPLRRWLTRLTDKILFKGEYEPQQVLNKLSGVLSSVLDLDEALSSIINVLVSEMRLERAAAFVLTHDPEQDQIVVKRAKCIGYPDVHLTLEPKNHLISYFEKYVKQISKIKSQKLNTGSQNVKEKQNAVMNYKVEALPIITEELERIIELSTEAESAITNTAKELQKLQAAIAIPIIVKGNLIGIFVLGGKKSGDIFTDSDLNLLTVVANQTAAAIEKARFYEEDQLKSEFVSIASHELLTPTSAIEGYLSMILDEGMGKVDAQAKGYLEKVYGSSKRLAHLVKDLLNVSRIEGGRIVVQSQNFDIAVMINDVITETMPKAKQKNLILKADGLDRELPQVWADPDRVHQVLVNLIGNSIKYTEKGSIMVRADFSLSVVRVSVIDTGVGIPKDEIPHLFEKFYRASNADNAGAQGTGLGLYITKNIVELMGGMIQVDSELGKGSVFSFSLPRAKDEKKQK